MTVFICFSGEYEQRGANAVFSSRELAEKYSDDVEEFEVWDRFPQPQRLYTKSGVFPAGDVSRRFASYKDDGGWAVHSDSYMSDEYHTQAFSGERINYWSGRTRPDRGIHVEVRGFDPVAIETRFSELQAEIENGRKPAEQDNSEKR